MSTEPRRVAAVRREPREKSFKLDLDLSDLTLPVIIAGGLVFVAVYKDQVAETIAKIVEKIPYAKDIFDSINIPIYPIPKIPLPQPQPQPGPTTGSVIFDSNRHWVGRAGQTATKFGNTGPNGKGFHAEASGNPKIRFVTPTEYELIGSGSGIHPRIYAAVNNYNSRLECSFKFNSNSVENITFKTRNRHQMGGSCDNRVGGFGCHFDRSQAGLQIEICHNEHEGSKDFSLPQKLVNGKWYRMAWTVQDVGNRKGIFQNIQLDYGNGFQNIGSTTYTGTRASYYNKSLFDRHSEFWIRYNGGSGSVGFKNVKMMSIGARANLAYTNLDDRISLT